MLQRIMEFLFWLAVALLVYVYAGYPLLVAVVAARRPDPPATYTDTVAPMVTIVVTAYNEAARIERRLENLLALDYPRNRLEILVGSDGSTDGTAEIARRYASSNVRVFAFSFRRGKPALLNDLIPAATGEIVVLADARQQYDRGALEALVARFADPTIGAVSGELMLGAPAPGSVVGAGVGFYWQYEKRIRRAESRVDSSVGATGAIYALRRELFTPIPPDTVLDDVLVPMQIVRRGRRVVFESRARAYDQAPGTEREEFGRKTRTIAGLFQLFAAHQWLLSPLANRLWLQTVSHKALRLVGPVLLVCAFLTSASLAEEAPYRLAMYLQVGFYGAAAAGAAARVWGRAPRLLSVPYTFCLLNVATIVGFWRFATAGQAVTWDRPASVEAAEAGWPAVRSRKAVRN